MLKNCTYDKVKLLHKLSSLLWFIENHAKVDAINADDVNFNELLKNLSEDLENSIVEIQKDLHSAC